MFRKQIASLCALVFGLMIVMQADAQQLIEVRFYHFRSAESAKKFDAMLERAALPVMEKQGVGPVGVFEVQDSPVLNEHARVTIVPYDSLQQLLDLRQAYADDSNFWPAAQDYLLQEKGNPAYDRVESMLLQAFSGMPQLKVPGSGEGKDRLFELRTYKSENEIQQLLKVKMFNDGEIELFKKVGLNSVFYGDAISAADLPQLTYMLVHEDESAQQLAWKTFIEHPEWKSLSGEEQYQVIKLQITKHMLVPTSYSQIR